MIKRIGIFFILFLIAHTAFAEDKWHTSAISKIYPHADGTFVITFKNDAPDCLGTGNPKYHYVRVGQNGVTDAGIGQMFSTALTAATSGKELTINFSTVDTQCYVNRLLISY